jgi:hypothetical protein
VLFGKRSSYPSIAELQAIPPGGFNTQRALWNYFAAWKLVHLLATTTDAYHHRFWRYLRLLRSGAESNDAWRRSFGDVAAQLSQDYDAYQLRGDLDHWTAPYAYRESETPVVKQLRKGEAHAVWIRLQMFRLVVEWGADVSPLIRQLELACANTSPRGPTTRARSIVW